MGNINLGTLYDVNKEMMQKEKKISMSALKEEVKKMTDFFSKGEYAMLLCHEKRDYTVFQLTTKNKIANATEELILCLLERGSVLSIEEAPGDAYEIWMRIEDEAFVYYLFHYDAGVIKC